MSEMLCCSRHVLQTTTITYQSKRNDTAAVQDAAKTTSSGMDKNTMMAENLSRAEEKQKTKKRATVYLHLFGAQRRTHKSLSP